ncbi:MAG TPA: DUF4233 domain-containing protein [Streptosporangiales bacterium]
MTGASTVRRPLIDVNRVTRRFCATMLIFEAIVFALSAPVAGTLTSVHMGRAWAVGGGLALFAVVLCGLLRHKWAYYAGSVLQLVVIACGVVVPAMYVLGVVFAGLWVGALWCGRIAHPHER